MKKFLCLLCIMILLGSLFILPVYAADGDSVIPAGEYYLNDTLTDFSNLSGYYDLSFSAGDSFEQLDNFQSFRFYDSSSGGGYVLRFETATPRPYVYLNGVGYLSDLNFNNQSYRYIKISSYQSVSSDFYNWFISNTTRLDLPVDPDPDPGDYILSFFGSIVDFFSSGVQQVVPMFFSQNLTVFGYILLLMLSVPVIFILISILNRFLNFR